MASSIELWLLALMSSRPPVTALTSITTYTAGNSAAVQNISDAWQVPAYDAQAGTWYEVETYGNAVFENQTLTFGISLNGTTPVAQATIGPGFYVPGQTFSFTWKALAQVTAIGPTGSVKIAGTGTVVISGSNISSGSNTNAVPVTGVAVAQAIDTTSANTLGLTVQWGAASAGQTLQAYGSKYSRWGY